MRTRMWFVVIPTVKVEPGSFQENVTEKRPEERETFPMLVLDIARCCPHLSAMHFVAP